MTIHPFGPSIRGDQVHFSLWAPDAKTVSLEVAGQETLVMSDAEDGWKEAMAPGGVGLRYRFRIGDIAFPDCSRAGCMAGAWSLCLSRQAHGEDGHGTRPFYMNAILG